MCAEWTFFHPRILGRVFDWMDSKGLYTEATTVAVFLNEQQLAQLRRYLGARDAAGIVTVEQMPGMIVAVLPGWAHQVKTVEPCLKIVWDYFRSFEELPKYATVYRKYLSQFTRNINAPDYMNVMSLAANHARQHGI